MRNLSTRSLSTGIVLALTASVLLATPILGRASHQEVTVGWHPQTGLSGPVEGARATLVRREGGVSFTLRTTNLRAGHAYTVWFVVINNPDACSSSPCNAADIILNPAAEAQVTFGAGHVAGGSGRSGFAGSFATGALEGWLPDRALDNPLGAEVQLVLNDHGPKLPAYLPEMIHTYRAGCTDASIPPIFPDSAEADGTPGPNVCQLYQVAVFPGS